MKLTVLTGPKLGAITSYELVDRHRAEALQFQNHEKKHYFSGSAARCGAPLRVAYLMG